MILLYQYNSLRDRACISVFLFLLCFLYSSIIVQSQNTVTICNGDSVFLYNNWETQNGIYTDGITSTTLIVNPTPTLTGSFILNGNASQPIPNTYRLTQALNSQSGSAWNSVTLNLTQPFTFDVDMFFGYNNGGADGIAFVLQPISTSIGTGGGGMGYQGVNPSFAVEFDTWRNSQYGDPTYDHLAVQRNGDLNHSGANNLVSVTGFPPGNINIENGVWHNVVFSWDPSTNNFRVIFNGNLMVNYINNIAANIFGGNPNVYWGFTAATGGANNLQQFRVNTLGVQLSDLTICKDDTIQINPQINSSLYTYLWHPNYNITNNLASTTSFYPDTTTLYSFEVTNSYGCYFTDSLTIYVNAPTSSATSLIECDSYTWPINNQTYFSSGTYTDLSINGAGCTHVDSLLLVINNSSSTSTSLIECDSYTWPINNQTYFSSGTYTEISVNGAGCTHVDTLFLVINNSSSTSTSLIECDSYTWPINNQTYFSSGTYIEVSVNGAGCTHVDTLFLVINSSSSTSTTLVECDSYTWPINNQTYFASGTYTEVSINGAGCTHVDTLFLVINNSSITMLVDTACGEYIWQGVIYNSSGSYTNILTGSDGCDSILNLELTIFEVSSFNYITACDSVSWNGIWFYNDTIVIDSGFVTINSFGGMLGCDSTATGIISIKESADITLSIDQNDVTCFNGNDGDAIITPNGGVDPYTYLWSDGQITNPAINFVAGLYLCTITDAIGCQVEASVVINDGNEIFLDFIATSPICRYDESTLLINISNSLSNTYTVSLLDSILKSFVIDTNGLLIPEGVPITLTPNFSGEVYIVSLTDNEGCTREFNDDVHIEVKQLPELAINEDDICVGELSYTLNNATPGGGAYFINNIMTDYFDVENLQTGSYNIRYEYTDPVTSCYNEVMEVITISESPEAGMLFSPQPTDIDDPNILFRDNSNEEVYFPEWNLGDGTIIYDELSFWHTYADTGTYTVKYYITNIYGCTDSVISQLTINPVCTVFIADAFTPNSDGDNDYFYPSIIGENTYNMKVYDRWGEVIYNEDNGQWDGKVNNNDIVYGVYTYSISVFDFNNRLFIYSGILNLIE